MQTVAMSIHTYMDLESQSLLTFLFALLFKFVKTKLAKHNEYFEKYMQELS